MCSCTTPPPSLLSPFFQHYNFTWVFRLCLMVSLHFILNIVLSLDALHTTLQTLLSLVNFLIISLFLPHMLNFCFILICNDFYKLKYLKLGMFSHFYVLHFTQFFFSEKNQKLFGAKRNEHTCTYARLYFCLQSIHMLKRNINNIRSRSNGTFILGNLEDIYFIIFFIFFSF